MWRHIKNLENNKTYEIRLKYLKLSKETIFLLSQNYQIKKDIDAKLPIMNLFCNFQK